MKSLVVLCQSKGDAVTRVPLNEFKALVFCSTEAFPLTLQM